MPLVNLEFRRGMMDLTASIMCSVPVVVELIQRTWDDTTPSDIAASTKSGLKVDLVKWVLKATDLRDRSWSLIMRDPHPFSFAIEADYRDCPEWIDQFLEARLTRLMDTKGFFRSPKYQEILKAVKKVKMIESVQSA